MAIACVVSAGWVLIAAKSSSSRVRSHHLQHRRVPVVAEMMAVLLVEVSEECQALLALVVVAVHHLVLRQMLAMMPVRQSGQMVFLCLPVQAAPL